MENMTLMIDPETRDLVFDESGCFKKIFDDADTVQNVRHALLTWKEEFFADRVHGTDYERILGKNQNDLEVGEVEEVIREAIFQEPDVSRVDELNVACDGRSVSVEFLAVLADNTKIRLEVTA